MLFLNLIFSNSFWVNPFLPFSKALILASSISSSDDYSAANFKACCLCAIYFFCFSFLSFSSYSFFILYCTLTGIFSPLLHNSHLYSFVLFFHLVLSLMSSSILPYLLVTDSPIYWHRPCNSWMINNFSSLVIVTISSIVNFLNSSIFLCCFEKSIFSTFKPN